MSFEWSFPVFLIVENHGKADGGEPNYSAPHWVEVCHGDLLVRAIAFFMSEKRCQEFMTANSLHEIYRNPVFLKYETPDRFRRAIEFLSSQPRMPRRFCPDPIETNSPAKIIMAKDLVDSLWNPRTE